MHAVNGTGPVGARAGDQVVTPEQAAAMLAGWAFPHQRALRTQHVALLAQAMAAGTYLSTPITVVWCQADAQWYLCDGQHRLSAVVKYGHPVTLDVRTLTVDTFAEVAEIYSRLDRGVSRSMADVIKARGDTLAVDVPPSPLYRLQAGLPIIAAGFSTAAMGYAQTPEMRNGDVRVALVQDWAAELEAYYACLLAGQVASLGHSNRFGRIVYAASVTSVALVTLRYQPEAARVFWTTMYRDDGLRQGTPEKTLGNYLVQANVTRLGRARITWNVAAAWNAAFEGRRLERLSVRDVTLPIVIAGTPYQGNRRASLSARPAAPRTRGHARRLVEVPADPVVDTRDPQWAGELELAVQATRGSL